MIVAVGISSYDLFLSNTCFKKRDSHLITNRSGNTATQIDFMLFQKSLGKLVMDVKVIPGEEVALQHHLLVCNMMIGGTLNTTTTTKIILIHYVYPIC